MALSYPLRNPLWPKDKDKDPLKWSHHQPKAHMFPENNMKALILKNMTKGKIILKTMSTHQVMPKVKFSHPPSKFKNKNKPKTTLKMIK